MSAYEVALTYAIADEHLKRLPDVDIHLVLVREEDQLFENVRKRGREMEKDQFEYLKFHYKNYYDVLTYDLDETKSNSSEIDLIEKWIKQGARYEKHWAFVAPVKKPLPLVNNTNWPKNEIDYFIINDPNEAFESDIIYTYFKKSITLDIQNNNILHIL